MLPAIALVVALGGAPVDEGPEVGVSIESVYVDGAATRVALEARVGDVLRGWQIVVVDDGDAVIVRVRQRQHALEERRSLRLVGETEEERSRELAAAITLLMDHYEDEVVRTREAEAPEPVPEPEPAPEPETPPRRPLRAWIGAGPRVGLGPPRGIDADVGVELVGGLAVLRDHLRPLALVGWTTTRTQEVSVHYIHIGAGLAGGAAIAKERLWIGAGVLPRAMGIAAREGVTTQRLWSAAGEAFALGQFRAPVKKGARVELLAALRLGVDVALPSLIFRGTSATVRRGDVRGLIAATIGVFW